MRALFKLLITTALVCVLILLLNHLPIRPELAESKPFLGVSEEQEYTFTDTNDNGSPITWNSCEPLQVQVETIGMPRGADKDVRKAVAKLTEKSDINLEYAGMVTGEHGQDRGTSRLIRKDSPTPPIIVGWTLLDSDMGSQDTIGFSSVSTTTRGTTSWISSAEITIHTKRLGALKQGFGRGNTQGQVYLHELAHAVGLGHVPHSHQLMYESVNRFNGVLTRGDIDGLNVIAEQMCPQPQP